VADTVSQIVVDHGAALRPQAEISLQAAVATSCPLQTKEKERLSIFDQNELINRLN